MNEVNKILENAGLPHNIVEDSNTNRDKEKEAQILSEGDPLTAYHYVMDEIKGRWLEAEDLLATIDPRVAYLYAQNIIKGPWPKAEALIAKHPKEAQLYATHILNSPWLEAEDVIASSPGPAYWYAAIIKKGPWPKAEAVINASSKFEPYYSAMCKANEMGNERARKEKETLGETLKRPYGDIAGTLLGLHMAAVTIKEMTAKNDHTNALIKAASVVGSIKDEIPVLKQIVKDQRNHGWLSSENNNKRQEIYNHIMQQGERYYGDDWNIIRSSL